MKLTVLITKDERDMIKAIAKDRGISVSDVVRMYIHNEYKKLQKNFSKKTKI